MMRLIILIFLLFIVHTAFAQPITTSISSPTVCVNDTRIGTVIWVTPGNATTFDVQYTSAAINATTAITDGSILLQNAAGTLVGTNHADAIIWPANATLGASLDTHGSVTDNWSAGLLYTDINNANFGVALAAQQLLAPTTSEYLLCTAFGFNIPACATVNGIRVYDQRTTFAIKSFVAGTKVWTPDGELNIETLKQGDIVYGINDGKVQEVTIRRTLSHIDPVILNVVTDHGMVSCSPEHFFYTSQGIKAMKNLHAGDKLVRRRGAARIIHIWKKSIPTRTYEIFLDKPHNYYANGFLVHNVVAGDASVDWIGMDVTYTPGTSVVTGGANMVSKRSRMEE